jgi:transcriptional regulator with XRE-family HTH domain
MDDDSKLALQLLAEQIKKRRKTLGLSQEKLAEKCGFDRTYISY